ncbi:MAG: response regulator [Bacteroidales bacterium]|nr:response regulator [Bacteroidales bacterium]
MISPVTVALFVIALGIIIWLSVNLFRVRKSDTEKARKIEELNYEIQGRIAKSENPGINTSDRNDGLENLFGLLMNAATDRISYYDNNHNLKYANPAFYSILGVDSTAFNSVTPSELIHPDDRDFIQRKTEALEKTGFFESEIRLRHHNGHYLNLSDKSVVVKSDSGEKLGYLSIDRDIALLKKIHADLVKANVDSEASNRLKSSFLANISHEIRTPLNSVVGFSNLLLADNITSDVREEYIEHINHNSEKLLQIIGDIIDLSRLESNQIEITYEETSLISIINEIVEDTRQIIRRNEKPILLNVKNQFEENGDLIFTDRVWLKRVLNHLMDNAVKFTLDGSIEFAYQREDDKIVFKIKDTGIGIKNENLSHIFEEFRQEVGGHHRPFEGLGIGLTLAKEVVERMGGKIFVKSEKGIGSEFSFSIPYRPAGSTKIKIPDAGISNFLKPIDWSSKKCLIVDDNKDVLIYLNRILHDTGVSILMARSGYEAIELVKSTPDIDVILLDMQMPEMNGIEATKEIRKIRKNIPIIAQTAFVFEDDKDIVIEAGCDACLIKPIRKDHLITIMSSFVKSR